MVTRRALPTGEHAYVLLRLRHDLSAGGNGTIADGIRAI
jgi:hypothetical protein